MSKGIQVGLQEGVIVRPGRLSPAAVYRSKCHRSRFHLFYLVGLALTGLAFSAQAQLGSMNVGAAVSSDAAFGRGTMVVVAAEAPANDQLSSETKTISNESNANATERNAASYPGIGVALVCGLALFVWVQRFRNSLV
jgi:hypothetical protein